MCGLQVRELGAALDEQAREHSQQLSAQLDELGRVAGEASAAVYKQAFEAEADCDAGAAEADGQAGDDGGATLSDDAAKRLAASLVRSGLADASDVGLIGTQPTDIADGGMPTADGWSTEQTTEHGMALITAAAHELAERRRGVALGKQELAVAREGVGDDGAGAAGGSSRPRLSAAAGYASGEVGEREYGSAEVDALAALASRRATNLTALRDEASEMAAYAHRLLALPSPLALKVSVSSLSAIHTLVIDAIIVLAHGSHSAHALSTPFVHSSLLTVACALCALQVIALGADRRIDSHAAFELSSAAVDEV
jgi:hypothetical protein